MTQKRQAEAKSTYRQWSNWKNRQGQNQDVNKNNYNGHPFKNVCNEL